MNTEKVNGPYCTAPWVESHLFNDGQTRPCDHNQESLGNWQTDGITSIWNGERYQKFRKQIITGEFPNEQCRSCYLNQNTSKLSNHIYSRFKSHSEKLYVIFRQEITEIKSLCDLFLLEKIPENWGLIFENFFQITSELKANSSCTNAVNILSALEHLANIAKDYISGELQPRFVAPIRQVRLINKCNARCIMCAGNFNGDIINGPGIDEDYIDQTLAPEGHVVSYSSETSEFLLYKKWKYIASKLSERGMPKLRIFSNGILVHPENAQYLIDNNMLEILHFSMNGASKETIESGQVNVNYEKLLENIRFVFSHAEVRRVNFILIFSFIIMKRNYHEIPRLISLVNELRGEHTNLSPQIYFSFLETNNEMDNYREFLYQEHHSLIDQTLLWEKLTQASELGKKYRIGISLYESFLDDYLKSKRPLPKLICKQRDIKLLTEFTKKTKDSHILECIKGSSPQIEKAIQLLKNNHSLEELDLDRDLILDQNINVKLIGFDNLESTNANRWRWALGAKQKIELIPFDGINKIKYKIQIPLMGTILVIKHKQNECVKLTSTTDKEVIEGFFDFVASSKQKPFYLDIEISKHNSSTYAFSLDSRPLAYCVYKFEQSFFEPAPSAPI